MPTSTASARPARSPSSASTRPSPPRSASSNGPSGSARRCPPRRLMLALDFVPGADEARRATPRGPRPGLGLARRGARGGRGMTRADEIGAFLAARGLGRGRARAAGRRRLGAPLRAAAPRRAAGDPDGRAARERARRPRPSSPSPPGCAPGGFSAPEVLGADRDRGPRAARGPRRRPLRQALRRASRRARPALYAAAIDLLADLQRRPPPGEAGLDARRPTTWRS